MRLNLNSTRHESASVSDAVNPLLEAGERAQEARGYLGASAVGHECMRRVQLDWKTPAPIPAKTQRIFARGHWGEGVMAEALKEAGFTVRREGPGISFSQADGLFKGHIDGRIEAGPDIPGLSFPCLWEAKTLGGKGWRELYRSGLREAYPTYWTQVQLYMAYCGLVEHPALFTALNADTMDMVHLLVPFDATEAQRASDRAVVVLMATEANEPLPRISDDPDFWMCKTCWHRKICHAA